jgi:hypothetical protein
MEAAEMEGRVPPTMATKAQENSASATSMAGIHGMTRRSKPAG